MRAPITVEQFHAAMQNGLQGDPELTSATAFIAVAVGADPKDNQALRLKLGFYGGFGYGMFVVAAIGLTRADIIALARECGWDGKSG